MPRAPRLERVPDPPSSGLTDDRVRDAFDDWVATTYRTRLEDGTREVPLQQVDVPSLPACEMRQLVDEEALAGTRKSGEEHHPPGSQAQDPLREPTVGLKDKT